VINVF